MKKRAYELRPTKDDEIDEILFWGADVHFERMDDGHYWVGIKDRDGNFHHVNLHARGHGNLFIDHERE